MKKKVLINDVYILLHRPSRLIIVSKAMFKEKKEF